MAKVLPKPLARWLRSGHLGTLLLLSLQSPNLAAAYCANPHQTVAEEYNDSTAVFVGRVVRARETAELCPNPGWTYSLDVKKVFRGHLGKRVEVSTENNSGRLPLTVGREYLLFTKASCRPLMIFGGCGHSALAAKATSVLRELEILAKAAQGASRRQPANRRIWTPPARRSERA